jgi:Ca-activated chloride channel homolog
MAIALAGPRIGQRTSRIQHDGIAIVMAVDASGSMKALDLSDGARERTRLDAIKEVFEQFVNGAKDGSLKGRPDDAIGIVSFARYADTRCPLTLDRGTLTEIARGLQIVEDQNEDGTAIGDGLDLAVERLRESKATSKVVILLTDGVNNAGDSAPLQAADFAKESGVKVYTVGAGTNGRAPIRVEDPFSGRSVLTAVPVQIDEETLKGIAERTGGRYFRATDGEALKDIYAEIDTLERTRFSEERFLDYDEYYRLMLAIGLMLACAAYLLRASVLRRLP